MAFATHQSEEWSQSVLVLSGLIRLQRMGELGAGGGVIQNGKSQPDLSPMIFSFLVHLIFFFFFFYKNCTKNDVGVRLSGDHQDCYLHFILKDLFPGAGWGDAGGGGCQESVVFRDKSSKCIQSFSSTSPHFIIGG